MIYVKVSDTLYPAAVSGKIADKDWDNRESKTITIAAPFEIVNTLFQDGTAWSIVSKEIIQTVDEHGESILNEGGGPAFVDDLTQFDNSEFSIRGDLTVHVDGTCSVKMGKPTDLEAAYEMIYGGL